MNPFSPSLWPTQQSFLLGLTCVEETTYLGLAGVITNLWFIILTEPLLVHKCRHGSSVLWAAPCRATGEKQQGFIYLMMTNTSPEESSRTSTNGTIKLVTKGTMVLDILIKLTAFPAKIPSAATQGRGCSLPGIWTSVFFASLCLSYCFPVTGWYFTLLRNQLIILLQAWGFSGSEHLPLGKLKGPMLWQICVALTFSVIYLGPISSPLTFLIDCTFLMQFPSWSQNATFRIPFAEKSWRNCGSSLGWPTIFICPGLRGISGCRTVHAETWIVLRKPSCAGPVFMSCPSQLS